MCFSATLIVNHNGTERKSETWRDAENFLTTLEDRDSQKGLPDKNVNELLFELGDYMATTS